MSTYSDPDYRTPAPQEALDVHAALANWPSYRITDSQEGAIRRGTELTAEAIDQTGTREQIRDVHTPGWMDWSPLATIEIPIPPATQDVYARLNDQVLPILDSLGRFGLEAARGLYVEAAAVLRASM